MVEFVNCGFELSGEAAVVGGQWVEPLIQPAFEVADALFHCAVVAWIMRRTVEWQDAITCERPIDCFAVERAAVVAFEEQRRAVLAKECFEVSGDLAPIFRECYQGNEAVTAGQVGHRNEFAKAIVFGGIDAPGQAGKVPLDSFHGVILFPPDFSGPLLHLPAGDEVAVQLINVRCPKSAFSSVIQSQHAVVDFIGVGLSLLWSGGLQQWLAATGTGTPAHHRRIRNGIAQRAPGPVYVRFGFLKLI